MMPLKKVDLVITDGNIPQKIAKTIEKAKVELVQVPWSDKRR